MNSMDLLTSKFSLANAKDPKQVGDDARKAFNEKKKVEAAKSFESILIHQLMDQMKNTVDSSGFGDDAGGKQMKDMFWSFLADETSNNGGMGLWEDIYKSFGDMETKGQDTQAIDTKA
jgi:Rod binding domain-containing protein